METPVTVVPKELCGAGTAQEAEMDVYPAVPEASARLVARPVGPTLATAGVLLVHVAEVDTSCVVPSEYCARAVNFCVAPPSLITGFCGLTNRPTGTGLLTVRLAGGAETPPDTARIVAEPAM